MESPVTQAWDRSHSNELRSWLSCVGSDCSTEIYHEGCGPVCLLSSSPSTQASFCLLARILSTPSSPVYLSLAGHPPTILTRQTPMGWPVSTECSGGWSHVALAMKGLVCIVLLP